MNEVNAAVQTVLGGDAGLDALVTGVFRNRAPEGQATPYVIYAKVSGPEQYTWKRLAKADLLYDVKVVDQGNSQEDAAAAMAVVHDLLHDQSLDVDGLRHLQTRRQATFEFVEDDRGEEWQHVGGTYRICVGPEEA